MKRTLTYGLVVVLFGALLAASASAQERKMYSWTDENGTVHFSETRPEGQDVKEQSLPQADPAPSSNPYTDVDSGPSYADQRREEIRKNNEEAQVNNAMTEVQCAAWQAEVERLEPNRRVFFTNDQGETERMDDVERTNRVAELKSQIAKNCK